ncbi:MAG: hypothetical protein PHE29_08860 [Tissierellia bacterium]|nr:hypothetical protein [Tissierellia bacterium]MDD4779150.1 hypothetical protein [Tissierellia bacterium]
MITGLEINSLNKEKIEMYELTKNTIVLFNNSDLKYKFMKEFDKIKYDETDKDDNSIIYSTVLDNNKSKEQNHKVNIKTIISYKPTSIFLVDDEQHFIFTTEAPFVLQCDNSYDLWFCDINRDNEIELYSFVEFKRYKEIWNEGIEEVYKWFIDGRFSCYEGYGR